MEHLIFVVLYWPPLVFNIFGTQLEKKHWINKYNVIIPQQFTVKAHPALFEERGEFLQILVRYWSNNSQRIVGRTRKSARICKQGTRTYDTEVVTLVWWALR